MKHNAADRVFPFSGEPAGPGVQAPSPLSGMEPGGRSGGIPPAAGFHRTVWLFRFDLFELFRENGNIVEQIPYDTVIRLLEDGSVRILVDGYDDF